MTDEPLVDDIAPVGRVWIEEGCIQCGWCSDLLPDVFRVTKDHRCEIIGEARCDGATDDNRSTHAALRVRVFGPEATFFEFVAAGCPAAVIKIEG